MILWDTSPPSSWSAGFLNEVAAPCLKTSSLDLLDCYVASSMRLDSIMLSKRSQTQKTWLHLYKKQNQTKYDLLPIPLKVRTLVTITGDGRNRKRTWRQLLECWYGFISQSYIYFFICKLYLSSVVLFLAISC